MRREPTTELDQRNGVLAAEVVLQVLEAFVGAESQVRLKTLAERTGMHPAKVHRYLVSLCRHGFVQQDPSSGLYHLAEGALELGLAAMESIDVVGVSRPILITLRDNTGLTSMLSLWGVNGPVVAVREIKPAPLILSTRVGSPLPLLSTATGWTFCAWLPRATAERAINQVRGRCVPSELPDWVRTPEKMDEALRTVRKNGVTASSGQMNPNVDGLSAPVFDGLGNIAAVVSVLGVAGQVDLSLDGETARILEDHTAQISVELGWHPDIRVDPDQVHSYDN